MNDDRPTDDDAAHARCVEAAARFVEEHDPESPLFARDLRAAAARIRELEAERDEGWAKYQDGKYEIARLTALGNALADAESLTALAAAQHEWRKNR